VGPHSASHTVVFENENAHTRTHTMAILSLAVKLSGFGVGYLYPVYCSLKLLDRKSNTQDDYVLWLTYMIIAFTMVIAESWGIVSWYVLCVLWCAVSCSGDATRGVSTRGARESCQSTRRAGPTFGAVPPRVIAGIPTCRV